MIVIKKRDPNVPVRTTMELAGQSFDIELLPLTAKDRLEIFKPFEKRKYIPNPVTQLMNEVSYFQDDKGEFKTKREDLIDKHVINFWGIGENENTPLDGSKRENKLLIASIVVDDVEDIRVEDPQTKEIVVIKNHTKRNFGEKILDKCVELSKAIVEAETKNFESSPQDTGRASL